jgi:NTE family protein
METMDKDSILKDIPLFANLSSEEMAIITDKVSFREYRKGQIIYQENSPADAFYCLVVGRVMIYTQDSSGNEVVLEYLHRGKYFGIISLLTQDTHSVTAKAINDSLLLLIRKEDFDFILDNIPRLAIDLSRTLSRRLKRRDLHQKTVFESMIISVFSSYSRVGKSTYAAHLVASLKKETHKPVIALDICAQGKIFSLPQMFGVGTGYPVLDLDTSPERINPADFILKSKQGVDLFCVSYAENLPVCLKKIVGVLSILVNDYCYIILDLPLEMDSTIFEILNQSDLIQILTSPQPQDLKETGRLIQRLKIDFHFPENKIKLVVNEYKLSRINYPEQVALLGHPIFATLPKIEFDKYAGLDSAGTDSEYLKVVRRVSRQLGDCLVGLALGVGVGYGFCHIGVLKVIEEEKIPIDVIAGSSIGALIASLWACGRSSQEILEITKEFKYPRYIWGLIDLTFPRLGFIKGNKLYKFLKKYLGNKTFYDVRLPLKIVASDVRKKESRILDQGPLVEAIMASCAMPGVFKPFWLKEEILLDGGIINPLPTEPLFKMGVKKIIAVNVTPSREDILKQYEKIKQVVNSSREMIRKKKWLGLKQYLKSKFRTNILDLVFSSIEIMQSEMAQREAQLADIVLHPDTSDSHWLELNKAEYFAKKGEEEARRNLDRILQLINE